MPKVIRVMVDDAQPHGYAPLGKVQSGSIDVITNGSDTARLNDPYTPTTHCTGGPVCHTIGNAVEGSPNVYVNNLPIHRDGDRIACGTVADHGSGNVFANSKDGTVPEPDLYGNDPNDTGGYAISLPGVMYDNICAGISTELASNWQYVDVLPWDGIYNAGWTLIMGEASLPDLKNYDGLGVPNPPVQLDPTYALPIDLTYEEEGLGPTLDTIGLTLDPDTGRIYGCPSGIGTFNVRSRHYYYDDDKDGLPGTPSPWFPVQVLSCGSGGVACS